VRDPLKPNRLGGLIYGDGRSAVRISEKATPEIEVFGDRQLAFHRIAMAEIVADFADPSESVAMRIGEAHQAFFLMQ
jgi:hypothetical protein